MRSQLWKKQKKQSTCEARSTLEKQKKQSTCHCPMHLAVFRDRHDDNNSRWWLRSTSSIIDSGGKKKKQSTCEERNDRWLRSTCIIVESMHLHSETIMIETTLDDSKAPLSSSHPWLWRKKEKTINLWGTEGLSTPELSKACTCISRLAWWWWLRMTPEHLFCHPGLWKKSNQPVRRGRMVDSRAPASLSIARTCIWRPHDNDDSRAPLSSLTLEKKEKTINLWDHMTPLSSLTLQ